MIKILTLIALLAFVSSTLVWDDWNAFATTNATYVQSLTASLPSIPSGYTRFSNQSLYGFRWNQYRYSAVSNGVTCNVYCGLRSFLTIDSNGSYVCYRDQNSNFWGTTGYNSYCIPDVDRNSACTTLQGAYADVGQCNMVAYNGNPQLAGYECCYNDANKASYVPNDLTKRAKTTNAFALRNAE